MDRVTVAAALRAVLKDIASPGVADILCERADDRDLLPAQDASLLAKRHVATELRRMQSEAVEHWSRLGLPGDITDAVIDVHEPTP